MVRKGKRSWRAGSNDSKKRREKENKYRGRETVWIMMTVRRKRWIKIEEEMLKRE